MMSVVSSLGSAGVLLYMFFEFSSIRKVNAVKLVVTYLVMFALCMFMPGLTVGSAAMFYLIVSLIYRFIYGESNFVSACNTFMMFLIHVSGSMASSSLVILISRKVVDFRTVFQTDNLMFLVIFATVAMLMTYCFKVGLFKLNDYFNQIKDQQRRLASLNIGLTLVLLLYLRMVLASSVPIVVLKDIVLELIMVIRLFAGIALFLWLSYMMNRNVIYSSNFNMKSTKILDQLLNRIKLRRSVLSVIYVEFPLYGEMVKKLGSKEAKKVIDAIRTVSLETISNASCLNMKNNSMLIILEDVDVENAKVMEKRLDSALHLRIKLGEEGERKFILGVTEYDPVEHETTQSLLYAAQESAYR